MYYDALFPINERERNTCPTVDAIFNTIQVNFLLISCFRSILRHKTSLPAHTKTYEKCDINHLWPMITSKRKKKKNAREIIVDGSGAGGDDNGRWFLKSF